jgi:small subunit ribosomal protein S16
MSVKIRMARAGTTNRPFYRIVAIDSRSARNGQAIEKLGTYNPLLGKEDSKRIDLNKERIQYWLSVGAQPSGRIARFLWKEGMLKNKPSFLEYKGDGLSKKDRKKAAEAAASAPAAPAAA